MRKKLIIVAVIVLVSLSALYMLGHKTEKEIETQAYLKAQIILFNDANNLFKDISSSCADYLTYKKTENSYMEDLSKYISTFKKIKEKSENLKHEFDVKLEPGSEGEKIEKSLESIHNIIGGYLYSSVDKNNNPIPRDKLFQLIYATKEKTKESIIEFQSSSKNFQK